MISALTVAGCSYKYETAVILSIIANKHFKTLRLAVMGKSMKKWSESDLDNSTAGISTKYQRALQSLLHAQQQWLSQLTACYGEYGWLITQYDTQIFSPLIKLQFFSIRWNCKSNLGELLTRDLNCDSDLPITGDWWVTLSQNFTLWGRALLDGFRSNDFCTAVPSQFSQKETL